MLFPYTYVPHKIEKMQEFIDFIFHEVWCKAPTSGAFRTDLFLGNPDLHDVMDQFLIADTEGGDFFYSHVERIYGRFTLLPVQDIDCFRLWYAGNNDIEKICAGDLSIQMIRYQELKVFHKDLCSDLASFFKGLYSDSLLDLAVVKDKIGDIGDHYQSFTKVNTKGKCPFCGMNDIFGQYHKKREAYDHYLPKAHYPFNSINFHNLVPACHHCNSSYKASKDPAYHPKQPTHKSHGPQRRKVFYPFTTKPHVIEIHVELRSTDVTNLQPKDVDLRFGPLEGSAEIQTWLDVYGIDERYKAKICTESDGKAWLVEVLDEWKEDGRSPSDYMRTLARHERNNPWADCRFLKKPFLEACERIGLFAPITLSTITAP